MGAFLLVRFLHLTVYAVAATGDPGLRRQVAISWLPTLAGGASWCWGAVRRVAHGHFPIVAGIVLAALGVEGVVAHAGEREPLGVFYALPLFGGVALYLGRAGRPGAHPGRPDRPRRNLRGAEPPAGG
jgi:hypothetical protein